VRTLAIERLSLRALRNLHSLDVEPGPRFNVISGDNGQGKTNLLEAIYVLATSRSFRASKPGDVVEHGGDIAYADDVGSGRGRERERIEFALKRQFCTPGGRQGEQQEGRGGNLRAANPALA